MDDSSSAAYVRLVHRLIEECILFNMSKEECMEALSKHANIKPVITSTVWKELEKENKEFFEAYSRSKGESASETGTRHRIRNVVSDSSKEGALAAEGYSRSKRLPHQVVSVITQGSK